jgi:hypothetical protein
VSSAYATSFVGQTALHGAKELWKIRAPNKCKMSCKTATGPWTGSSAMAWKIMAHVLSALSPLKPSIICYRDAPTVERFGSRLFSVSTGSSPRPAPESFASWWLRSRKRVTNSFGRPHLRGVLNYKLIIILFLSV